VPVHQSAARGRLQQSRQHAQGGGLAGSVRTQQTEDFAIPHLERDAIHDGTVAARLIAKSLRKALDLYHWVSSLIAGTAAALSGPELVCLV